MRQRGSGACGDFAWLFEWLFACRFGWLFAIKSGGDGAIPHGAADRADSILPTFLCPVEVWS
jgi:hypothetical protein